MNDAVVDETYNLRSEAIHWWNIIGSGFKSYWMRWITPAHREIILLSAFYGTYKTPRGEEYAKYLLDFSIPQLLENNGGKLIAFIENVIQRGIMELDASVPPLNDELDQTISHWIAELDDKNEYGRYKGDNIMCLKAMIHFSRATFAMRFTSQVMELWQVISGEFSADLVSEANPLGIKVSRPDQNLPIWMLELMLDRTISTAHSVLPELPSHPAHRASPRSLPKRRAKRATGERMVKRCTRSGRRRRRPKHSKLLIPWPRLTSRPRRTLLRCHLIQRRSSPCMPLRKSPWMTIWTAIVRLQ